MPLKPKSNILNSDPKLYVTYRLTLHMMQTFYHEINGRVDKEYVNNKVIKYINKFLTERNIPIQTFVESMCNFYNSINCEFTDYDQVLYYKFYLDMESVKPDILEKYVEYYTCMST